MLVPRLHRILCWNPFCRLFRRCKKTRTVKTTPGLSKQRHSKTACTHTKQKSKCCCFLTAREKTLLHTLEKNAVLLRLLYISDERRQIKSIPHSVKQKCTSYVFCSETETNECRLLQAGRAVCFMLLHGEKFTEARKSLLSLNPVSAITPPPSLLSFEYWIIDRFFPCTANDLRVESVKSD